jgi:hypothetical protein
MEPEEQPTKKVHCGLSKKEYQKMKKEKRAEEKSKLGKIVKIVAPDIILDGGALFDEEKRIVFSKIAMNSEDKSRAGELDEAIMPFVGKLLLFYCLSPRCDSVNAVDMINSKKDYYTTSSCAGRSIVFHKVIGDKYKCDWIYLTHDLDCNVNEILLKLNDNIRENKLGMQDSSLRLKFYSND